MKQYDFIVSLGASCGCTMVLRELNLQFVSSPLDWAASPGLARAIDMIEHDFKDWFNREDMKLWAVRHEKGTISRIYKNTRTEFGFPHDFSNAEPFEACYEKVREKYERRIERFLSRMAGGGSGLCVYLELSYKERLADDELVSLVGRLRRRFPNTKLDFVYIYVEKDRHEAVERKIADGIIGVGVEYRVFNEAGELTHLTNHKPFSDYLRVHYSVVDTRTEAEKVAFKRAQREKWMAKFGRNSISRWINRKIHAWYCSLAEYLMKQHLLPEERPTWFHKEDK